MPNIFLGFRFFIIIIIVITIDKIPLLEPVKNVIMTRATIRTFSLELLIILPLYAINIANNDIHIPAKVVCIKSKDWVRFTPKRTSVMRKGLVYAPILSIKLTKGLDLVIASKKPYPHSKMAKTIELVIKMRILRCGSFTNKHQSIKIFRSCTLIRDI